MSSIGNSLGTGLINVQQVGSVRLDTTTSSHAGLSSAQPAISDGDGDHGKENTALVPAAGLDRTTQTPVMTTTTAGSSPLDTTRIAAIRHGIASGNYNVSPAMIGDAMIASGFVSRRPGP